jgi:hypothetical protein
MLSTCIFADEYFSKLDEFVILVPGLDARIYATNLVISFRSRYVDSEFRKISSFKVSPKRSALRCRKWSQHTALSHRSKMAVPSSSYKETLKFF